MALMSVQGIANLQHQWSIVGEFSNIQLEELVEWINVNTRNGEGQADGTMPFRTNCIRTVVHFKFIVISIHDFYLSTRMLKLYLFYSLFCARPDDN